MKAVQFVKMRISKLAKYKTLLIISGVILCFVLVGATAYARYYQIKAVETAAISSSLPETPAQKQPEQTPATPQTSIEAKSPTPAPATVAPQQSSTTPPSISRQSTTERRASLPMPASPIFGVGHLAGGVACYTGVYAYALSNISVSVTNDTKAFLGFYWQVELSDGTILEKGGAHIPYGSTILPDFPSTPSMPSSFKLVYNPPDGLSARFVITSPNYVASNWASPVPTGSGTSCHASPDYVTR